MTRVKLTCSRVGTAYDGKATKELPHGRATGTFSQAAGSIVNMPDDEAERYIERGLAELAPKDSK